MYRRLRDLREDHDLPQKQIATILSFTNSALESGISNADKISDIPLSVLENMSKKDMESFILYLRERPFMPKLNGVSMR